MKLVPLTLVLLLALGAAAWAEDGDVEGAVVRIVNHAQRADRFAPWNAGPAREESGSGFVVDGGRIMTNAHVVSDSRLVVLYLHRDPTPYPARVVAIGHDCDLALLEPLQPGVLDGAAPVAFGGMPALRSTVETFGYPAGGRRLSSTRGVVSRVELQRYVHSGLDAHLTVQTDAAINPGNSGGPVVQDGRVVGVAFQGASQLENVGFFIPTEVVEHFLVDVGDGRYDGYPELGAMTQTLENQAARAAAGMAPGERGVSVFYVFPESSADGLLLPGDVLLRAQGHEVANDGTVAVDGLRFEFGVLVDRLQVGDTLTLTVLREGVRREIGIPLRTYPPQRRFANAYDEPPRYFVYAGMVFVPLDREMLATFGPHWSAKADKDLLYEFLYRFFSEPERLLVEPVVLLRCLDHPVNADLLWRRNALVRSVNRREVRGLADLVDAFESNQGPHQVIEFEGTGRFDALDRAEAARVNGEILERYGVTRDRRL